MEISTCKEESVLLAELTDLVKSAQDNGKLNTSQRLLLMKSLIEHGYIKDEKDLINNARLFNHLVSLVENGIA